jgi:hypothetical protein
MSYERFLIYKGSGGLAHNLNGLTMAIHIAETQARTLIIDMQNHSAFQINFSDIFVIKTITVPYFDTYVCIPSTMTYNEKSIQELSRTCIAFKPDAKPGPYLLFNQCISQLEKPISDPIVFHAGWKERNDKQGAIQVNDTIMSLLNNEPPIQEKYISIHFRNTDIKNNIDTFIKQIKQITQANNIRTVYLASDDSTAYDKITKACPTLLVIRNTIPPAGIRNLHYTSKNKFEQIYNSLRDIFFIVKSAYFIPSYNSGFSELIIKQIQGVWYLLPNIQSTTHIVTTI